MRPNSTALMTDLYELTMAAGYFKYKKGLRATFELFCHSGEPNRRYLIACGIEQASEYLLNLRFSEDDIRLLKKHPVLKDAGKDFFDYLRHFKFSGDMWAMREGEIFFPLEPVVQIEAPLIEAQIIETYLLSLMHIGTLVASKASRVVSAAKSDRIERGVVDFGSRRSHGPEAGVIAARASYIGGCIGTSNLQAGLRFGIPTYGTMAHSWIEAFDSEKDAFEKFLKLFPASSTLLIDTYDTVKAAKTVAGLKKHIRAVRLDSGDLSRLAFKTRRILDAAGMTGVKIMASGNLNEYKISELVKKRAPIDIFGVGTEMVTSKDAPALDMIYKLVRTRTGAGRVSLKAKFSQGKRTIPDRKQVYRFMDKRGTFIKDVVSSFSERPPQGGERLLEPVIEKGRLVKKPPAAADVRSYAMRRLAMLPAGLKGLNKGPGLRIDISANLKRLSRACCGG